MSPHAKGNGVNDDRPSIQAAINLAAKHGGGVVYLPAGTYKLAYVPYSWGLTMASGVVIQGHAAADTKILLGSAQATPSNFSGIGWPANATLTGLANLSIQNLDTLSQDEPRTLVEVIWVLPGTSAAVRATDAAIVSGSAPGRRAETEIVGKSTVGEAATGSRY
jgi:Pectate lyase superfamily protein